MKTNKELLQLVKIIQDADFFCANADCVQCTALTTLLDYLEHECAKTDEELRVERERQVIMYGN